MSYGPDIGFFIGGGRTLTVYGFRKNPYSSRHRFRAGFATGPKTYRVDYRGDFRRENSPTLCRGAGPCVRAWTSSASAGSAMRSPHRADNEFYRVTQDAFGFHPSLVFALDGRTTLQVGPVLKYVSTDDRPGPLSGHARGTCTGRGNFGEIGGGITLRHDSRDRPSAATRGVLLELGGNIYPAIWDVDSTFGEVHGEAAHLPDRPMAAGPTLALRIGGKKLWGHYPFFESAFIGGASTVRLGKVNRYAGDASAYGSVELRLSLARLDLVLPADFGVFGLADVGRVFLQGESSDRWHAAGGGGIWVSFLDRAYTRFAGLAASEGRTRLYAQAGFGF